MRINELSTRFRLLAMVVGVLAMGALVAPVARAHPDPLQMGHKRVTAGPVVRIDSPAELSEELVAVQYDGTAPADGQAGEFVYAGTGCSPLSYAPVAGRIQGNIALVDSRESVDGTDQCPASTFAQKVQSAQQAGAIGFVAIPAEGSEPNANATAVTADIPALEVYRTDSILAVRDAVVAGSTVTATLLDTREPLPAMGPTACTDGLAGPFACDGIDLLSFTPQEQYDGNGVSDIWGWTDQESGDEYVMLGKTNGVGFFRVTDPTAPQYLGALPNAAVLQEIWHDIKVYDDHAFIVSESTPHGMTIFDLRRLRGVSEPREWDADAIYPFNVSAHNIAINEDTGFAYIVGGSAGLVAPDQCLSGLHMVDINDPTNPVFAGCYLMDGGPGTAARTAGLPVGAAYVHDTQCVVYDGPDVDHQGRELCFNAAEDKVTIADVTDKLHPTTISTIDYEGVAYAHQGWLTEDHRYLLTNDELDEITNGTNTRTVVLDVSDLDNPVVDFIHEHETESIDHNNYVKDGLVYQSNYTTGLRVLDLAGLDSSVLAPLAFFDTYPFSDGPTFDGTWSNYPFFDSGTIAVSGIGEGLFLVRLADATDDGGGNGTGKGNGRPDHAGPKPGKGPKK